MKHMSERKLATIRTISSIADIPGKDRIGLAMVDGWSVIVQKSDFKVGDLCGYCEIDSILPDAEWTAFLKDRRIRTMKMAGCISQGICFPMSILPKDQTFLVGDDVTDVLGITKYEHFDTDELPAKKVREAKPPKYPAFLMRMWWFRRLVGKFHGKYFDKAFPTWISKTDEERIQNCPFYLNLNKAWVLTEKLDGSSATYAIRKTHKRFGPKYEYIICSRNVRLYTPDGRAYWTVYEKYHIKDVLTVLIRKLDTDYVILQGEVIGPGVQGNKYRLKEHCFYCFNFITDGTGRWSSADGKRMVEPYGISWVPIVDVGELPDTVEEMLDKAHGKSLIADTIREGLVCRSLDGKFSFKAVDPLFLLKWKE